MPAALIVSASVKKSSNVFGGVQPFSENSFALYQMPKTP